MSGRPQGSELDPHQGSIARLLKEDAPTPATVIIQRLRRDGYDGGITILKDYLREVRPLFSESELWQRTSYLPGEIGQTDWWDTWAWVPVGEGRSREVFGLVITLPYSAAHAAAVAFGNLPQGEGGLTNSAMPRMFQ